MENVIKAITDFFAKILSEIAEWVLGFIVWIVNGVFAAPLAALLSAQGFSLQIPDEVFNVLNEITYCVGYILPLWAMTPIITLTINFYVVKIVISVFSSATKIIKIG